MAQYRLYFWDRGRIVGREDFEADIDAAAIPIAEVLFAACSDRCQSFDLWEGTRRISSGSPPLRGVTLAELHEAHQRVVIETEELISRSEWVIARSRRLLKTLEAVGRPEKSSAEDQYLHRDAGAPSS